MAQLKNREIVEAAWCVWALLGLEAMTVDGAVHLSGQWSTVCVVAFCGLAALQVFLLCLIIASTFKRLDGPKHAMIKGGKAEDATVGNGFE